MAKKELFSDVDELVSSLNKELGEGSIMNFGDDKPIISIPRESTGSLVVDKALGGGWAVGRIHELVGMESCGKTMMCTLSMIEFQKKHPDKLVAIIDVENAFDIEYARKMGLFYQGESLDEDRGMPVEVRGRRESQMERHGGHNRRS